MSSDTGIGGAEQVASLYASVGANVNPLGRALKNAQGMVQSAGNKIKGALDQALGVAMGMRISSLVDQLLKVPAALISIAKEGVQLAARNQMMATTMKVVGKNAGWVKSELNRAVGAVKEMGITTAVATNVVTKFIQTQMAAGKTSAVATQDMVSFAGAARDLAVVAGTNTSNALETMSAAVSGLRPRLLKTFGITDGLIQIYRKHADQLNISVSAMTNYQRRQAVFNRIIEEGTRVKGAYVAAMGDVAKQLGSMQRYIEEAKVAVGEHFLPVLEASVKVQTLWWKALEKAAPVIGRIVAPAVEKLANVIERSWDTARRFVDFVKGNWIPGIVALGAVLVAALIPSLTLLPTAIGLGIIAFEAMAVAAWASIGPFALLAAGVFVLVKAYESLKSKHEETVAAVGSTSEDIRKVSDGYEDYKSKMMDAAEAQGLMVRQWGRAGDMARKELATVMLTQVQFDVLSGKYRDNEINLSRVTDEISKFGDAPQIINAAGTAMDGWLHTMEMASVAAQALGEDVQYMMNLEAVQEAMASMETLQEDHIARLRSIKHDAEAADLDAAFNALAREQQAIAEHTATMTQLEVQYQTAIAASRAAGDLKAVTDLTGRLQEEKAQAQHHFDEAQTMAGWNADVQEQIRERERLKTVYVEKKKYHEALVAQYAYAKASIETATITAMAKGDISTESGMAMLRALGSTLPAAMAAENAYARGSGDVYKKWAGNVSTAVGSGIKAMAAWKKAQELDIAAAQTGLAAAQADLAGFQLDLPPLVLPPLPDLAGFGTEVGNEIGGAAEGATQRALASAVTSMQKAVEGAKAMFKDLVGLELPAGLDQGLEVFKVGAIKVAKAFHSIWKAVEKELEESAEAAPAIRAIADTFSSMLKGIQIVDEGSMKEGWVNRLQAYVWGMGLVVRTVVPELNQLRSGLGDDALKAAQETTSWITSLFGLFSHVDKIMGVSEYKPELTMMGRVKGLWEYVRGLGQAATVLIPMLKEVGTKFGKDVTDEVVRVQAAMSSALGLLKFSDSLGKLGTYRALGSDVRDAFLTDVKYMATEILLMASDAAGILEETSNDVLSTIGTGFSSLSTAFDFVTKLGAVEKYLSYDRDIWESLKLDIEELLTDLSGWSLSVDIAAVDAISAKLQSAGAVISMMRKMVEDVDAAAELGGLDLSALRGIIMQFNDFFTAGERGAAPSFGDIQPGGGGFGGGGGSATIVLQPIIQNPTFTSPEAMQRFAQELAEYLGIEMDRALGWATEKFNPGEH